MPSQIRFYRDRSRKLIAIFEEGHEIEPPLLEDSQIPHATIVTIHEFVRNVRPAPATVLQEAPPSLPLPNERRFFAATRNDEPPRRTVVSARRCPSRLLFEILDKDNSDQLGGESTIGIKRRRESEDDEGNQARPSRRPKSALLASPVTAFVLGMGVAVGALNTNVIGRICEICT